MIGIFWEVPFPRVVVLLLVVVALDVMRGMEYRVLIVVLSCIFIEIIVV